MPPRSRLGRRALVVVSRYNEGVTRRLLDGATAELSTAGFGAAQVEVLWVPGAFELPLAVHRGLETGRFVLAVALGAVIRGDTPHFEYVSGEVAKGIGQVAFHAKCAVTFGVLTTDTIEQAVERSGTKAGNKGVDAALAALELANLLRRMDV